VFVFGEVQAELVTRLAGEDLVQDWIRVAPRSEQVTHVIQGTSVAANASVSGDVLDVTGYRKFGLIAIGYGGNLTVHVDVSANGGVDWIGGLPDGDLVGAYINYQPRDLLVTNMRVTVTNSATVAQNFNCWLTLGR
jgi:hypothetical protein